MILKIVINKQSHATSENDKTSSHMILKMVTNQ